MTGVFIKKDWDTGRRRPSTNQEKGLRKKSTLWIPEDLGFLASRTMRKLISVVEATWSVVLCYGRPGTLIQPTLPQTRLG